MKTSRRLLLATSVAMLMAPVVVIAYSRIMLGTVDLPAPERTSPAELAALRDFSEIRVGGDFALEVVRADTWSIEYTPLADNRGNLNAFMDDGALVIEGFGNRTEFAYASVRVGLPDLDALDVGYTPQVALRNFTGDTLALDVGITDELILENNRFDSVELNLERAGLVTLRGNTFGSSVVRHFGTTLTTD